MDLVIDCTSVEISGNGYNSVEVTCCNIDESILETVEVCNAISMTEYISHLSNRDKEEMLSELVDEIGDDSILDNYTNEELLARMDLDEILDYFQKNLINHV